MTLDFSKHKNLMLQILKDVYTDPMIGPFLGFKGGTAAHFFYGLNRSSVDLDFDLLDKTKEQIIFEKIQKIAEKYGKIVDSHIKQFNLIIVIAYDKKSQNIKIEINRKNSGSRFEIRNFLGISMLVMIQEDMSANKILAMYERMGKTSRDIYDVWFFLKNDWPINKEIVNKRPEMEFRIMLQKCADKLEKMDNRRILEGLGEFLTQSQKDWVRAKLRSETIFLLKARLEAER